MSETYGILVQLGLQALKQILSAFVKSKVPQEIIDAVSAAVTAVEGHWADIITKPELESLRG